MTIWLTPTEGGEYAKCSAHTIRQAVKDGDLKAYPVGRGNRLYRVTAEDIDEWMRSRSWEPRRD
jgi:excisionase family DNA binding protein